MGGATLSVSTTLSSLMPGSSPTPGRRAIPTVLAAGPETTSGLQPRPRRRERRRSRPAAIPITPSPFTSRTSSWTPRLRARRISRT